MKGKIFAIKKRFKGKVTLAIDINDDDYLPLDPNKEVEIIQK